MSQTKNQISFIYHEDFQVNNSNSINLFPIFILFHSYNNFQHMQSSNSWINENIDSPQCCLVPFFSNNYGLYSHCGKNERGLTVPLPTYQPLAFQKGMHQSRDKHKHNAISFKRSISSLKDKHLLKNNITQNTKFNPAAQNISHIDQKTKISIRNSNGLQRYSSPQASPNTQIAPPLQLTQRKNLQSLIRYKKQLDENNYHSGKVKNFVKKQIKNGMVLHSKFQNFPLQKVGMLETGNYGNSNSNNGNKMEIPHETDEKPDLPSTGVNFNNFSATKDSFDYSKTQRFDTFFYVSTWKNNPQELLKQNNNKKNFQSQSFDKNDRIISLQHILEEKKPNARQQSSFPQFPVSQFKKIESFVVGIKKQNSNQNQQNHYGNMRKHGRQVESIVQMARDLTKTKKMSNKKRQEPGLHEMENVTVTSEYDDNDVHERVQKIQESAVLFNFFNPPKDLKEKLELSKHGKQAKGRSAIY